MRFLYIDVLGRPAPQGSKRHVGKGVMVESSKHVRPWRDAVRASAVEQMAKDSCPRFVGPVRVSMVFYFDRPKSHYRTGKNAGVLRDDAPSNPATIPDLSKLIRSTEDALTDAGVWEDDARVVEYTAIKAYTVTTTNTGAFNVPGVAIRVAGVTG
jgi:Holliday junction resolvase RusA-like endonuclease